MTSLRNLVLAENLISGQLPHEMSSMTNLGLFSCFRRFKDGPKLAGTLPDFSANPTLTDLYLDHNNIKGTIPSDFLAASSQAYLVNLGFNDLTGEVPKELVDLPPFQIELEGNQITGLPKKLCKSDDEWQQGDLGIYGCDAFMCKPGYYSKYGRQNTTDSSCLECNADGDDSNYWGSTTCGGKPPPSGGTDKPTEYKILMELYLSCGGSGWTRRDNWGHDDVHFCDWYGITCTERKTVQTIRLGANNIIGTPPPSLFDLPDLELLWLYSNPISFSFENIGSATNLYELRLDSTNLGTVKGISGAPSLEVLDLRFNRLKGNFPLEILELTNMISLQMGDNYLEGPLPGSDQWAKMKTLEELRLGVNRISGRIPDFRNNVLLSDIDFSHNLLSGEIPSNFISKVPSEVPVVVNLANNRMVGPVPEQLDRFEKMTLYLRGNQIEVLPVSLCDEDNGSWNKGDVARYSCDAILCSPGTYNELGRQSSEETPCLPCSTPSSFYGQTACGGLTSASSRRMGQIGWISQSMLSACILAAFQLLA